MKTFSEGVIAAAQEIPCGYVATYGDIIARAAGGGRQAARSVTRILSHAAHKDIQNIPFHRIVYSGGRVWSHHNYDAERHKLYKKEGIIVNERGIIKNFDDVHYQF